MADGLLDVIAHPYVPPSYAEQMQQAAQQAQTVIGAQQQQFDLTQANLNRAYSLFAPAMGKPNATWGDVMDAAATGQRQGLWMDPVNDQIAKLRADPNMTPREALRTLSQQGLPPSQLPGLTAPRTQYVNVGNQLVSVTTPGPGAATAGAAPVYSGTTTPAGTLPLGLTPGEATAIDNVQIGGGQTLQVPHAQAVILLQNNPALQQLNPGISTTPPAAGGGGGGAAAPGPRGFTPYVPPGGAGATGATGPAATTTVVMPRVGAGATGPAVTTIAMPGKPLWAQPPPPAMQGGAAGGLGVTPAPGYPASREAIAGASTAAYNNLQAAAANTANIEPLLSDMETQAHTPGFETGLGALVSSTLRQALQFAGVSPREPGGAFDVSTPEAAKEQFAKDAARLQAAQLATFGNQTDARQALAETTNPGLMLSKYGNLGIIHMLQGNQQAIRIMSGAWAQASQAGWTPDRFNEWMSERFLGTDRATGGRFDPRVFWFANEGNVNAQWEYVHNMSPASQTQFRNNLNYAIRNGWLTVKPDHSVSVAGP